MAKRPTVYHTVSKLFRPTNVVPVGAQVKSQDLLSKSSKLMIDEGIIAPSQTGFYYYLPLAIKALEKLTGIVEQTMLNIGAQKISCPTLTSSNIWKQTDRLSLAGPELFSLNDRHSKNYILSPTHEESVTQLFASLPALSYKQLPLMLYQVTSKFRDEMKPRFGLIRTREFLMKDLYSFDSSEEAALATYNKISEAYQQIFNTIGVSFIKVKGVSGMMGGEASHEFHYPAPIGEDTLHMCGSCGHSWNRDAEGETPCQECGGSNITETKGIEVGHTFQLGTRYSLPLKAVFNGANNKPEPLVMGSYGLGLSRILAASLEVLSLPDQLRWPPLLTPYSLIIITPKKGSKESKTTEHLPEQLYWSLQEVPELENNVIVDDRSELTIGKRMMAARRTGYPLVAVVGKEAASPTPLVELHDTSTGHTALHSLPELVAAVASSNHQARVRVIQ